VQIFLVWGTNWLLQFESQQALQAEIHWSQFWNAAMQENSRYFHKNHISHGNPFAAFRCIWSDGFTWWQPNRQAWLQNVSYFSEKNVVSPLCRFGECVSFYKQPNQGEEQSWVSIWTAGGADSNHSTITLTGSRQAWLDLAL